MSASWFALQVRVRMELKVAAMLRAKGYEESLPIPGLPQCGSDPLFARYVSSRISREACGRFVTPPSVIRVVSFIGKHAPVNPEETATLQLIKESGCAATAMERFHDEDWARLKMANSGMSAEPCHRFEGNTGYGSPSRS